MRSLAHDHGASETGEGTGKEEDKEKGRTEEVHDALDVIWNRYVHAWRVCHPNLGM